MGPAWIAWGGGACGRASASCSSPSTQQRAGTEAESFLREHKCQELDGERSGRT